MIDPTKIGGSTPDPIIVAGVPMTCAAMICSSLTVVGVPTTGASGLGTLVNYSDDIRASIDNLSDGSLVLIPFRWSCKICYAVFLISVISWR